MKKHIEIYSSQDLKIIDDAGTNVVAWIVIGVIATAALTYLFGQPFSYSPVALLFWFNVPAVWNATALAKALGKWGALWFVLTLIPILSLVPIFFLFRERNRVLTHYGIPTGCSVNEVKKQN